MKKAVILFNLGGPDKLENVEPFLFNLFNDPAILDLPKILKTEVADDKTIKWLLELNDENKNSNYTYNRQEFGFHKFEKSFDLPISIQTNKVTSYYRNGVLTIKLPKRKEYQNIAKQIVEVKN